VHYEKLGLWRTDLRQHRAGSRRAGDISFKALKCGVITSQTTRKELQKTIQEFEEGKKDLLLGVAAPYGILVRGLDYPLCFRYTLFWGAPFLKVSFGSIDDLSPGMLALLAFAFRGHPEIEKELPTSGNARTPVRRLKC